MRHSTRISVLLATLFAANLCMAQTSECPRLVVCVTVDQLRSDYMESFMPLFSGGGFKKLLSEGRIFSQAQFPFSRPDRASATACIYSGCSPYQNGVVGEKWMNRQLLRPVYSVDDERYNGVMTADKSSPRQIGVSTLTDELKVSTDGRALVYSIAPFRDAAVFSAGHAANSAVWIDDYTGKWCTSTYYGGLPTWAAALNEHLPLSERVKQEWTPFSDLVGNFNYISSRGMREPFSHRFSPGRQYIEFKTSGLVNEEVGKAASACIQSSGVGIDDVTDLLAVTFYAGNFCHNSANALPMEMQDIYVRLDYALESLIKEAEAAVGKEHVMFVLTSTGYCDEEPPSLEQYRIPTGEFSVVRATSLLNMYLGAVYGQERWIETHYGNQIFLNHKLVEDKGININEMLERCSAFLIQMSGVEDVYTSQRLALGAWTPGIKSLRNSINPKFSGDIILDVQPGWHVVDEDLGERHYERESYMAFPVIFYGANIDRAEIETPIETDCIAPTIARAIRIRAPNASSASPLVLKN